MPSYLNHILTNFALALILLFFYQKNPFLTDTQLGLSLFGYFLGTVVLSPDLDSPKSKPSQKCGIICKPLTIMSKHRGLNHHWLIGTVLRILYIVMIISFLLAIVYGLPSVMDFFVILLEYKLEMLATVGGVFVANLFHYFADVVF